MLELRQVTKDYAVGLRGTRLRALDDLSLTVARGEVCGLLGPNGSGKSTVMKLLAGLQTPTAGECHIRGRPCSENEVRQKIGYLPESPGFPAFLTVGEVVRHYAALSGLGPAAIAIRTGQVLEVTGLARVQTWKAGALSKGQVQRLGCAQALVHDPELLLLDEPTAGVDPQGVADLLKLIKALKAAGRTILLTSHLLDQVAEVCDRIAILGKGRLLFAGTPADLAGLAPRRLFSTEPLSNAVQGELAAWLAERGHTLADAGWSRRDLEDFYLRRVGCDAEGEK